MTFLEKKRCEAMTEQIAKTVPIDEALKRALASVPREPFVPLRTHAYRLDALPLASSQWISSPITVAKMILALKIQGADSVLEIGCGSGYAAAVLSRLVRRVFTIERIERLADEARANFKKLDLLNIHLRFDDGQEGWERYAPYERILFSAVAEEILPAIFAQLAPGGILLAPMKQGEGQRLVRFSKSQTGELSKEVLDECLFVPILSGRE